MAKPKIYVTRQIFDEAVDRLREATDMKYWDSEMPPSRDELLREVRDIDGLFCLLTEKIDAELFDAAPNLRVVSNMAVGFDNIDVAEATKRGIPVGNTPGVLTETTADFAFALLMAAGRRVSEGDRYTRAGNWKTWGSMVLLGQDIHGLDAGNHRVWADRGGDGEAGQGVRDEHRLLRRDSQRGEGKRVRGDILLGR